MTTRLLYNYWRMREVDLTMKVRTIVICMTGNDHFPNAETLVAEVEQLGRKYEKARAEAKFRDTRKVAKKKKLREELCFKLNELKYHVTGVGITNYRILASSGFDVIKPRKNYRQSSLLVKTGKPEGKVSVSAPAVRGAKAYIHQYMKAPYTNESDWIDAFSLSRKHTYTNLQSGVKYIFRAIAVTKGDKRTYTNMVFKTVQ